MALQANALVTLNQAKDFLKIPLAELSQDALVELLVNSSSDDIEEETGRKLKAVALTEYHHGRGGNILQLREWPVASAPLPQVWIDSGASFAASTEVAPSELRVTDDGTGVLRVGASFPIGYGNIKVTYTAGFATIPASLQEACLWLVFWKHRARQGDDIGRTAKSKGGEVTSFLQEAPAHVKATILRHKRTEFPSAGLPVYAP